jgi:hypothetical protein
MLGIEMEIRERRLKLRGYFVNVDFRRHAFLKRDALDIDAVFVSAGKEISLKAALSFVACDYIGNECGVQAAEMRRAIGVINRGRNVECLGHINGFVINSCCP